MPGSTTKNNSGPRRNGDFLALGEFFPPTERACLGIAGIVAPNFQRKLLAEQGRPGGIEIPLPPVRRPFFILAAECGFAAVIGPANSEL